MKKISYLAMIVIAFIATSCLGGSDTKIELTRLLGSAHNFTVVQRASDNRMMMFDTGAEYNLQVSVTEGTVSLSVSNLRYWGDQAVASFRITDAPYTTDKENGAFILEVGEVEGNGITIKNFKMLCLERPNYHDSEYYPAWDVSFTVSTGSEEYVVRAVQNVVALFGPAYITETATDKKYTDDVAYYQFVLDPKTLHDGDQIKGHLTMLEASFAQGMPAMNLRFDFDATVNVAGFSINNASSIKLYLVQSDGTLVEQPDFVVTSLSAGGLWNISTQFQQFPYSFTFTVGDKYLVQMELGYTLPADWLLPQD
ncbi:MAG: hypothetical protein K2K88_07220 [Muribaculaceae bacterium]|nr:hypothetical protein [Muribaculaceae bacterium]